MFWLPVVANRKPDAATEKPFSSPAAKHYVPSCSQIGKGKYHSKTKVVANSDKRHRQLTSKIKTLREYAFTCDIFEFLEVNLLSDRFAESNLNLSGSLKAFLTK